MVNKAIIMFLQDFPPLDRHTLNYGAYTGTFIHMFFNSQLSTIGIKLLFSFLLLIFNNFISVIFAFSIKPFPSKVQIHIFSNQM